MMSGEHHSEPEPLALRDLGLQPAGQAESGSQFSLCPHPPVTGQKRLVPVGGKSYFRE